MSSNSNETANHGVEPGDVVERVLAVMNKRELNPSEDNVLLQAMQLAANEHAETMKMNENEKVRKDLLESHYKVMKLLAKN